MGSNEKINPETAPASQKAEKKKIHEQLDQKHLETIHMLFERQPGKQVGEQMLRAILYVVAQIEFEEEEFSIVFMKINLKRDGKVTWDEFVSYLILSIQQEEIKEEYQCLEAPIPVLPVMIKSNHRHPVNQVTYAPTVNPDRTISWSDGSVMTCSKDGTINYWSLDMQIERTVQSVCTMLKIQPTWVLDMVVMPDVSVVCTSSTERDLRFYDTSARKFELRVHFTSLDYPVTAMHYVFSQNIYEDSKLLMGNQKGGIKVIYIPAVGRGPFKSTPGTLLVHARFEKVVKGLVPGFRLVDLGIPHTDFVRQISFYNSLHSVVSCAACHKAPLILKDITQTKDDYVYRIPNGAWCFTFCESVRMIASGGPDCLVRIWNPFVPNKPTAVLYGHHTGVVKMVFQDNAKTLYSLSKDKCVKVWDVTTNACLQTYLSLPPELGEHSELTALHNPESRQWIIGSIMIAVIPLSPKQAGEHTDGNTHIGGVSVVLYNPLFKVIATCGLDSFIIIWDPWDGRRMSAVRNAHTRNLHGEDVPIEITAGSFEPGYQRLVTAAHDGSLKVWQFNTGTCLRNMRIAKGCEITCVLWVHRRIMAIGWNRCVTEFTDTQVEPGPGASFSKNWDKRHRDDISAAAMNEPLTLATATYSGELVFWQLETGQAYKRYNVSDPTNRIKIQYKPVKDKEERGKILATVSKKARRELTRRKKVEVESGNREEEIPVKSAPSQPQHTPSTSRGKMSGVLMPEECMPLRKLGVHCLIFLTSRQSDPAIGTLLASLENGIIQVWSHHNNGGFITSFQAVHRAGDYVISMTTSADDEFLFTGSSSGYVKTWLLKNYATTDQDYICMPKYRIMFPFLWGGELIIGRAKRITRCQPFPMLLNSYKAHRTAISALVYIDKSKILVTGSTDSSSRMWTLGGKYIQTIGTFKPWKKLPVEEEVPEDFSYSFPPDIYRIASSTTLRVIKGGAYKTQVQSLRRVDSGDLMRQMKIDRHKIYGTRLVEPYLGSDYRKPTRALLPKEIKFDTSFPYIPVYQHLSVPLPVPLPTVKKTIVGNESTKSPRPGATDYY